MVELAPGTTVAGVFTTRQSPAHRSTGAGRHLAGGRARAIVVNSGNANVFTGARRAAPRSSATAGARPQLLGCRPSEVFIASTGVIGEPLPRRAHHRRAAGSCAAASRRWLGGGGARDHDDRHLPQGRHRDRRDRRRDGRASTASPRARGMIAPDMATMLATSSPTRRCRRRRPAGAAAPRRRRARFNCITVDSDTSTSDTRAALRDRQARHTPRRRAPTTRAWRLPRARSTTCCSISRMQVVRDGEGAQKFDHDRRDRRGERRSGAPHRARDRQLAAGQDRDRRRGRQLGPHRHGGRQGRRAGRPRPARRSRVGGTWMAAQGGAGARLRRGAGRRAHEGPRDRHRASISASAAAAPRSGPAT